MKKIISFLICIVLCITGLTVSAGETVTNENKYLDIAVSLGLMDSSAPNDAVTKAQAAQIAANLLYKGNIPEKQSAPYDDVPAEHPFADAVSILKSAGYFGGGDMFYPDSEISFDEAITLMTGILGYKEAKKNGVDINYTTTAGSCGLLTGVKDSKTLTASGMARIIYNLLDIPMLVSDYSAQGKTYKTDDNVTFAAALDIYEVSGVLTATHNAAVSGNPAPKGCIRIDADTYYTKLDMDRYTGARVTAYARAYGDDEYSTINP